MGLKDFFKSKPDPAKEAAKAAKNLKLKKSGEYSALSLAINMGDLARVKEMVKDGVDITFYSPDTNFHNRVLVQAYRKGNPEIFKALLDSPQGAAQAGFWIGGQSQTLHKDYYKEVYFSPYMVRTAIEEGKSEIALLLARREGVDIELGGGIHGDYARGEEPYKHKIKPLLDLAREKGMIEVAEAIEERLKPLHEARRKKAAEEMAAKAANLREQAEKLQRDAEELHPSVRPAAPATQPPKKLNL